MGLAPHSAASAASPVMRSGLSAGRDEQVCRCLGAHTASGEQGGVGLCAKAGDLGVEPVDLACEGPVAASEDAQRLFGRRDGLTAALVGAQARAGVDQRGSAQIPQRGSDLLRNRHEVPF